MVANIFAAPHLWPGLSFLRSLASIGVLCIGGCKLRLLPSPYQFVIQGPSVGKLDLNSDRRHAVLELTSTPSNFHPHAAPTYGRSCHSVVTYDLHLHSGYREDDRPTEWHLNRHRATRLLARSDMQHTIWLLLVLSPRIYIQSLMMYGVG